MIISFRCPPKLKEKIDALIAAGFYPDFSSFCVTALENQLLLEETSAKATGHGVPAKKNHFPETVMPEEGSKSRISINRRKSSTSPPIKNEQVVISEERTVDIATDSHIPLDLSLSRLDDKPPFPFPSILADVFQAQQMIPIERWLFGQYNRLLPAKVSVRALAVISMEGKDSLALGAVAPRIAEVASVLGDYLRLLDRRFANHRDDAITTAFPDGGIEGQKGRVRYQNHFVGHTVKGEQGGMLVGLKLAVIQVHKNKPYILPTIAGWDFARLANPILDLPVSQNPPRLSKEEIVFLLQHIKENVPVEVFAYRVILSLISQGENTPESVNQHLVRHLIPDKNPENEQDFISTQRNGVLGRMTDLGLVNRERQGTRITYHLAPEGKKFLTEIAPSL